MATYAVLADVDAQTFQNPQELTTIWGEVRNDVEQRDGALIDSYAVVGDWDFLLLYEADDARAALQIAVAIERHGLDTNTMQVFPVDALADVADDI